MDDFKAQVKQGFLSCKSDIKTLALENEKLNERLSSVEKENFELKKNILEFTSQIKGLEIAMNYIKNFGLNSSQNISNNVNDSDLKTSISTMSENNIRNNKLEVKKTQDPYEALLAFKAKSNKKEILKQKIISMINESGINLSELKFLFVDHYNYCSKATFYNYIKELEYEKYIVQRRENNKTFVYLLNSLNNQI